MSRVLLRFTADFLPYAAGETASFEPDQAKRFVEKLKVAEFAALEAPQEVDLTPTSDDNGATDPGTGAGPEGTTPEPAPEPSPAHHGRRKAG